KDSFFFKEGSRLCGRSSLASPSVGGKEFGPPPLFLVPGFWFLVSGFWTHGPMDLWTDVSRFFFPEPVPKLFEGGLDRAGVGRLGRPPRFDRGARGHAIDDVGVEQLRIAAPFRQRQRFEIPALGQQAPGHRTDQLVRAPEG